MRGASGTHHQQGAERRQGGPLRPEGTVQHVCPNRRSVVRRLRLELRLLLRLAAPHRLLELLRPELQHHLVH